MLSCFKKKNHKVLLWCSLIIIGFLIIVCALLFPTFIANITGSSFFDSGHYVKRDNVQSMNGNVIFLRDDALTPMDGHLEFLELDAVDMSNKNEHFNGISLKTDVGHVEFIEFDKLRLLDGVIEFKSGNGLRSMDGYFEFLPNGDLRISRQ
jgi:hypothetical protein